MNAWLEFFGIWMTEGCTIRDWGITIATHKQRVKDKLECVCQLLNFNIITHKDKKDDTIRNAWCFNDKRIVHYFIPLSVGAVNKYLPEWCFALNIDQTRLLINGMLLGDGHTMANGTRRYDTSSTKLSDDFQRLCLHAGWSCNISIKYKAGRESYCAPRDEIFKSTTDAYRMTVITSQNTPIVNKNIKSGTQQDSWVDYDDKVYCCTVPSGIIYVRNCTSKIPVWSGNSRHGQKGTAGNIIPEEDMPFTASGLRPDIIINPHAIPSRMTIGQLKETLLGKVLAELGLFGDGTSFGNLSVDFISKKLLECGYESYGNEIMYDGMSGAQLEQSIFIGPVFYQRLKHMVKDKQHSRANGPMVNLTHQPAEGKSRDGGLRFGEMERDCMVSHGTSRFTQGRMMDASDKYQVNTCNQCGMIVAHNDNDTKNIHVHHCKMCDNRTDFSFVKIPYSCKLLFQELQAMNVNPRIITDDIIT